MENTADEVKEFLAKFHAGTIDEVFTGICSYWFAMILFRRFIRAGAVLMYDRAQNCYGTQICGRVYDISGDVTDGHEWVSWLSVSDRNIFESI